MAAAAPQLFPENLNTNNNRSLYISLPDTSHEKIGSLFYEIALSMHCSLCEEKKLSLPSDLEGQVCGRNIDKGEKFPNQESVGG